MKKGIALTVYLTLSLCAYGQESGSVERVDCFLRDCRGFSKSPHIEFGYLTVPENYDQPIGRQVRVAFAIVRSQEANPRPDPILYFEGGWGMPTLQNLSYWARAFPVKDRDIIFFDYRGSGYSEPALCPELGQRHWALLRQDLNYRLFNDSVNALSYACLQSLQQQQIDYTQYGTAVKTRDAVVLLQQLGYREVNLFGISNGTMGIQGFIRAAENSDISIRSVLSDSNMPMGYFRHGNSVIHYKNVLDSLLDDCARNAACAKAYPDLKNRFYRFLNHLQENPVPATGKSQIVFNHYEINGLIHQLMYSNRSFKDVPLLLEELMAGRTAFFDHVYDYFQQFIGHMNGASFINYVYDWKAHQAEAQQNEQKNRTAYPTFTLLSDFYLDFFIHDTTVGFHARDTVPVVSHIPTLVLAGSYDPATPPQYSEVMHQRYHNSFYYVLSKIGHGAVMTPCGAQLYRDFIESPQTTPPATCVDALRQAAIPFTTSYYRNEHISALAIGVAQQKNIGASLGILIITLFSLIFFVRELVRKARGKGTHLTGGALSLAIAVFFSLLTFYVFQTANSGGLLILIGLVGAARWLPWLAVLILALSAIYLVQMGKTRKLSFWLLGLAATAVATGWVVIRYGILPAG